MRRFKWSVMIFTILMLLFTFNAVSSSIDPEKRLTLDLEEVPLATVLNMIAKQHNLNLVISGDVSGEISLHLEDVDINTALETILGPMGYNFYIKDDIIVVKPYENFASGELESRSVTLKYLTPATAVAALEPIKSTKGKIVVLDKVTKSQSGSYSANRVLLVDFPHVVNEMAALIDKIDQPERVISIEAKIIESQFDSKSEIGFSWPTSLSAALGQSSSGSSEEESSSIAGSGTFDPNNQSWTWSTLTVGQMNLVLNLLDQTGNSKLISDPRITTLENHEAIIKIETIIPIATINRFTEGSATSDIVTFQDQEVGISLTVTPRINEDGRITLTVFPKVEDIIGYTGPIDSQKPITTSRSIQTSITVNEGETIALGGLLKEDMIENVYKVPLLGHIPILGKLLFTSKKEEKTTKDLIILITPRILPN